MLAALDFMDFVWIAIIVSLFAGGSAAALRSLRPSNRERLRRLEGKVDAILGHLGVTYQDPIIASLSAEVRQLADDPNKKIQAIKLLREQSGMGLKEAKDAVEAYVEGRK